MKVLGLTVEAYGLTSCQPFIADSCPLVAGGPAWLTKDTFDIDAKSPAGSDEYDTIQLRNGDAPERELAPSASHRHGLAERERGLTGVEPGPVRFLDPAKF